MFFLSNLMKIMSLLIWYHFLFNRFIVQILPMLLSICLSILSTTRINILNMWTCWKVNVNLKISNLFLHHIYIRDACHNEIWNLSPMKHNFFNRKFWNSYIFDLAKTAWALRGLMSLCQTLKGGYSNVKFYEQSL